MTQAEMRSVSKRFVSPILARQASNDLSLVEALSGVLGARRGGSWAASPDEPSTLAARERIHGGLYAA